MGKVLALLLEFVRGKTLYDLGLKSLVSDTAFKSSKRGLDIGYYGDSVPNCQLWDALQ